MTTQVLCPSCSSEKVYSLLNTFHCKRCKNIWSGDTKKSSNPDTYGSAPSINKPFMKIKIQKDKLETRMEKRLNEYLRRFRGKFSMNKITWKTGDITPDMFRSYLKICVKNKTLAEKKDSCGIVWYSRPVYDSTNHRHALHF